MSSFDYINYDERAKIHQAQYKEMFETVETVISAHENSRAKSLALTKLEEAYMWVGKMLRAEVIARNPELKKQAALDFLVDAGIATPDGQLHPNYRDEE